MVAILITTSSIIKHIRNRILLINEPKLQTQFSKRYLKFPKMLMKKCLKMVANNSELLFYFHDCMLNILNNFCIITNGAVMGRRRPPLNYEVNVIFNMIPHK